MGVPVMKEEELEAIGSYVKNHIAEWIKDSNISSFTTVRREPDDPGYRDISLSERIVRVEEGIKHQGDLLERMLEQIEKRFEQVDKRFEQVDKRFEQVDKRFEELRQDMNARFDQVDRRFSQLQWTMGLGFTIIAALMGVFNFF